MTNVAAVVWMLPDAWMDPQTKAGKKSSQTKHKSVNLSFLFSLINFSEHLGSVQDKKPDVSGNDQSSIYLEKRTSTFHKLNTRLILNPVTGTWLKLFGTIL